MVPDVHHAVELVVSRAYIIYIKQFVPVLAKLIESLVDLLRGVQLLDDGMRLLLVDDLWSREFLVLLILHITQQEDEVTGLTRLQGHLNIMRGDGTPAMGMTVAGLTLHDSIRVGKLVIETHECLTVRVITLYLCVHMIESIVVTTLTILCLVIDR